MFTLRLYQFEMCGSLIFPFKKNYVGVFVVKSLIIQNHPHIHADACYIHW